MASRVAGKIKLQSVDELLGVPEIAGTQEIEIGRIHAFPNHPFKVLDDEKMDTLVDSIRENGILNPVIVRPDQSGNYEMISGHRRLHAAKIVGLKKVPAIVKEMSDDEAIIKMVDANIQREEILPSERAFSFKMKMEAMSRQGKRTDLTSDPVGPKLSGERSNIELSSETGDSTSQIKRYIRLTSLVPELLDLVDEGKIKMRPAVELSYLDEDNQRAVVDEIDLNQCTPSHDQTIRMRKFFTEGKLTPEVVSAIMSEEKPNQREKIVLRGDKVRSLIPKNIPVSQTEDYVVKALEHYSRFLRQRAERDSR